MKKYYQMETKNKHNYFDRFYIFFSKKKVIKQFYLINYNIYN